MNTRVPSTEQPPAGAAPPEAPAQEARVVLGSPCPRCTGRYTLDRERADLLTLLAYGMSDREIAEHHAMPMDQVRARIGWLLEMLRARNRPQAVDIGCRAGLLRLREKGPHPAVVLTPVQSALLRALGRGHTMAQACELLGLGHRAGRGALEMAARHLRLTVGNRKTSLVLYLLHSERALPEEFPCPCRPPRALPTPREIASASDTAVRGMPCLECGSRVTLTEVQHRVLELMARGLTNKEILHGLKGPHGHSYVEFVAGQLRELLGAANRAQSVDLGWRHGLLAAPRNRPEPLWKLADFEHTALLHLAAGATMDRLVQVAGVPRSTLAWRIARIREHLGVTGPRVAPQLVHVLHALGGVLPDGHPCQCDDREQK
ncbi:hypothetical protein [Kitasatospora purpeofusca]|uniref:hypothetical protein n=1 Tax=Kitasatospora purpeofusca TaxID=67352 RepID=UPI00386AC6CB|nr:hypothetical protein OIP63_39285 [Kitasatospora purpeofusca]